MSSHRWLAPVMLVAASWGAVGSPTAAAAVPPAVPETTSNTIPSPTFPPTSVEIQPETIGPDAPVTSQVPVGDGDGFIFGPVVRPSRGAAAPGERVTLSIDGFESAAVTITVCGNEARRGSADCNLTGSFSNEFNEAGDAMALSYVITAPPADCPCVIRVVGRDTTEVALAPFVVDGHPIGPVQDPALAGNLFAATVTTRSRSTGALDAIRSELGGDTAYEVTVRVTNTSTSPLSQVRLSGSVGPNAQESLTTLTLEDPGLLGVGQTWEQTVIAVVPAPSFGEFVFQVAVSGAGPTKVATTVESHRPWLLIVLVLLVVFNVWLVILRFWVRRRKRLDERSVVEGDTASVASEGVGDRERTTVGI